MMISYNCETSSIQIMTEVFHGFHDSQTFTFSSSIVSLSWFQSFRPIHHRMLFAIISSLFKYSSDSHFTCIANEGKGFLEVRSEKNWCFTHHNFQSLQCFFTSLSPFEYYLLL